VNTSHRKEGQRAPKPRRRRVYRFEQLESRQLLADWYAAPTGAPTNAGTINSPWDLQTALLAVNTVDAGDTIYLRGGTYYHPDRTLGTKGYSVHLEGDANARITVRPYQSEHVIIDGGIQSKNLAIPKHLVIRDLEVIVSENLTQSRVSTSTDSLAPDLLRPWGGIEFRSGHDIQIINNVIHANMQGIGLWGSVTDSQAYGNLIYDNGWIGPDRGHGHGVYTQNAPTSEKLYRDNLIFGNLGLPYQAYGSSAALTDNVLFDRNFVYWFNGKGGDLIFGGNNPTSSNDFVIRDNVMNGGKLILGYSGEGGTGLIATDNTIWHGELHVRAQFENPVIADNFIWKNNASAPENGDPVPTAPRVFFNTNAFDTKRANLAIMNFTNATSVQVQVGTFLNPGDTFSLQRPSDFFGTPEFVGVYAGGGTINVPLSGEFSAYVLVRTPPSTAPTISSISNRTVNEDTSTGAIAFTVADLDTPVGNLILSATSTNTALVPNASLVFGGSGANRTLTATPAANATGTSTITVTVSDGVFSSQRSFLLTVQAVNDPPTISNVSNRSAQVGAPFSDIVFTVGDLESSANSLTVTVQSSNLSVAPLAGLVVSGTGASRTLKITPAAGVLGSSTITLNVRDPSGATSSDTFTLTVTADTTAPTASGDSVTTTVRKPSQINVLANDTDLYGDVDPGTVVITANTAHGMVTVDHETGLVTFRPQMSQAGTDQFRYRVRDLNGNLSNEATVNITVLASTFGAAGWAQNMYLDVLDRPAANAEIAYWNNVINGGVSRETIAYAFVSSREERACYIGQCYEEYLGRAVDQAGENFWLGVWDRMGGPEWIRAGLIGSGEYFQSNGGTSAGAVGALYEDLLGRSAVTPEVNYWVNVLQHTALANVAMGFLTSDEYRLEQINAYYQYYLHRSAEGGGAQFWLQKMKQGLSHERLQAILVACDEYYSYS
jgi:hypothetical protein